MKTTRERLQSLLERNPQGLSCTRIAEHMGISDQAARHYLRNTPGVRVMAWDKHLHSGRPYAIWGVGEEPDEPAPPKTTAAERNRQYRERRK